MGPLPECATPTFASKAPIRNSSAPTFRHCRPAGVERVATGFRWAEGPAYFREGNYLLFSDIPNNRIMRLLWDDNRLSVFREPSNNSNGNTVDPQGRLVTCEHRTRRVTRTELDGSITVIADKYNGKRLNSPNDVVVASNGSIWFTDPTYGIGGNYEGLKQAQEQDKHYVFRVDGKTSEIKPVVDDSPNLTSLSPDEKKLCVIFRFTDGGPSHIRVFDCDIETGGQRQSLRRRFCARHYRRNALRCGWQRVVQHGLGRPEGRRRALLQPLGGSARQDPPAGDVRQPGLWRAAQEPSVRLRQHVGLRTLCRHAGRAETVI